ncbi:MAG: hypothetical protein AB1295_02750 [Candidatus Micrarchaeota archaeon]
MEENKQYDIKLPSHGSITFDKIWDVCKTIARTGRTFTVKDLLDHNPPSSNGDFLSRILSYLRYLGIVEEKRVKTEVGGAIETLQRWQVKDDKKAQEMIFLLEDNREQEALGLFREVLKTQDIYVGLKKEKFEGGQRRAITLVELKDFLRTHNEGKKATSYTTGAEFLRDMLVKSGLGSADGNKLILTEEVTEPKLEAEETVETKNTNEQKKIEGAQLMFSLKGKGMNFEFPIESSEDLEGAKEILGSTLVKRMLKEAA